LEIIKGVPASPGLVIGRAHVIGSEKGRVPERFVRRSDTAGEVRRFKAALELARKDVQRLAKEATHEIGAGAGSIFDAHLWIMNDKVLQKDITERIERNLFTAEYAVSRSFRRYGQAFNSIKDKYLAERVHDVQDVEQRLLATLMGSEELAPDLLRASSVIVAPDLTPSQTASLPRDRVLGFVVDVGGPTSHSAILARALQIPAVLGAERATTSISSGDQVIVDGNRGLVVVNPDRKTLARYRKAAREFARFEAAIASEKDLPAVSADGIDYKVMANMEFPEEIDSILEHGADGVGLFRTEFLYLRSGKLPTEEEHYGAYCEVAARLGNRPMVVRTMDLGADKVVSEADVPMREQNPFLGCRSIRLSQLRPEVFRTQVRAILRAAARYSNISVMLPMVTVQGEVEWARTQIAEVREELRASGRAVPEKLRVGIMVEVPATALRAQCFAPNVDFFSIGTNDLIQYTLAVDRSNTTVAGLYNPAHPAVLQLIRNTIAAGSGAGIPVSMCGEMAGDPLYTVLLVGMGLREFSVTPPLVPEMKKIIRSIRQDRARELVKELDGCVLPDNIVIRLRQELEHLLPGAGAQVDNLDLGT
jgi:phosphotransferase system enzyme I (PtsI)